MGAGGRSEHDETAAGAVTQAADEPPISVLSSRTVGGSDGERFVMVDVLGEGGMGRVLAYQDRLLGRRVAVKLARKEGGQQAASALRREAQVAGQLEHPNIIPIYDMGEDPEDGPFYLMRMVREPSLEHAFTKVRRGQSDLSHGRLLRLFIQVCQAVEYAHSRGIIHCDLKPENVLLGSFGEVFVVDWGFAYKLGDDTRPRGGTPGYMPPEALARQKGEIDARTDIFSLGVIPTIRGCSRRCRPASARRTSRSPWSSRRCAYARWSSTRPSASRARASWRRRWRRFWRGRERASDKCAGPKS